MKTFTTAVLLLAIAGSTFAIDCSTKVCILIYQPVCGSDGVTYGNACQLGIANCWNPNVTFAYNGRCKTLTKRSTEDFCEPHMKSGACTREYNPLCATDGKTYPNKCVFCAAMYKLQETDQELAVDYQGPCNTISHDEPHLQPGCKREILQLHCTEEDFPLCGSDGRTYGNACKYCKGLYKLEDLGVKLSVKHLGECTPDEYCIPMSKIGACPFNYNPVCANDSKTYPNLCSMCAAMYRARKAGEDITLKEVHEGPCDVILEDEPAVKCSSRELEGLCTKEYAPVCGTDGKTYGNKCMLCNAKAMNQDLDVEFEGECPETFETVDVSCEEHASGFCTKEYNPVCGSNGKTYGNKCMYCNAHKKENSIAVAHVGECTPEDFCLPMSKFGACPFIYSPVCASDGKTYPNQCMMCAAIYKRLAEGDETSLKLREVSEGPCEQPPNPTDSNIILVREQDCKPEYLNSVCDESYAPVCASDKKTYKNRCLFCQEKNKQENLEIIMEGHCPKDHICTENSKNGQCTDDYRPVCSNTNEVYANECELCADMYRRQKKGENIFLYVKYEGTCPSR